MVSIPKLYALYKDLGQASTDTRKLKPADMFFALKGPNFNGNKYVEKAFEIGAAYCVIDDPEAKISERCLLVKDVLIAMQELATYHRQKLGIPIIAIAGSNGKTTTKELVGAVLHKRFNVFHTQGNLNNH